MPRLSHFNEIIIRMYSEAKEKHNVPHFHAFFAEYEAVIGFDGEVIEGSLPKNKLLLVLVWVELHRDELLADWELLNAGNQFFKITPFWELLKAGGHFFKITQIT